MAKFCPLFSGSSGNSTYIGSGSDGILIDAGVSARALEQSLWRIGVNTENVKNIFITHEHTDHVKGLRVFTKKFPCRVFMTEGTYEVLSGTDALQNAEECIVIPEKGVEIGNMCIKCFHTSHDTKEPCGYTIELANGRKMAVVTDLGLVTTEVLAAVLGSDLVLIESNHDVNMLQCGNYPYMLQRRILGAKGHLSNDACAEMCVKLVRNGATRLILGHLSKENNIPALAYKTTEWALSEIDAKEGTDYLIRVAKPEWDEKAMIL